MLMRLAHWLAAASPAAWLSAVAASFSALSALIVMRIQRRNFFESVRPQIILIKWVRPSPDRLRFGAIKNIGKGTALNVFVNASRFADRKPVAFMSSIRVPILASDEELPVDEENAISLWWKNVTADKNDRKTMGIDVVVHCWDTSGRWRYDITYRLLAFDEQAGIVVGETVPNAVVLSERRVTSTAVWRLRMGVQLARIGRVFRSNR
jgi:hypothetical protein